MIGEPMSTAVTIKLIVVFFIVESSSLALKKLSDCPC